jgi:antitoxin component YwqK of YwqJK toxin-antitoxin module
MKFKFLIVLLIFGFGINAQRFADQIPQLKRYKQSEVLDSVKGICVYDKLVEALGGDSVKYNKQGYNIQGWNEEYYLSGTILHKGYYVDGKIKVFKNYYENGQLERSFINPDPLHANMNMYYENGQPKLRISYYDGKPQKTYHYYETGLPKLTEEKEKDLKYTTSHKEWFESGQIYKELEMIDLKEKKFKSTLYYANGQIKEQGNYVLASDGVKLEKLGTWVYFDEKGKKIKS